MYKNKIPTPKFQIFDKYQPAFEYIKNMKHPVAIKPDNHNKNECTKFAETRFAAQKIINNLFNNGNDKIIIEDYIAGKNIEIFVLSDGFKFKILGASAKYQNDIAHKYHLFLQ